MIKLNSLYSFCLFRRIWRDYEIMLSEVNFYRLSDSLQEKCADPYILAPQQVKGKGAGPCED